MTPAQRIVDITNAKKNGSGWKARCPAHDDRNPSLSITEGDDGRILLHCHAGCTTEAVVGALGLTLADLMPEKGSQKSADLNRRIVATYDYTDRDGKLLFQSVRCEGKKFFQRRPDGNGGWIPNIKGIDRVLYALPHVLEATPDCFIFMPEGEKDCDRINADGGVATTTSGGAKNSHHTRLDDLHGLHVILLADNDRPGLERCEADAARLHGKAASVRVVMFPDLPEGGDVSDWLDAGHDLEELVRLAEATAAWGPGSVDDSPSGDADTHTKPAQKKALAKSPVLIRMADVEPQLVRWLWRYRIPRGKVTLIAGDPGLGKSFLTLDIASRTSTGAGWPDMPGERFDPGGVVLLSAEDDPGDTIRPRLDALGADVSRITYIDATRTADPETGASVETPLDLTADLDVLERAIIETPGCKLAIIDPISAYLGGTDSHKNAEVRAMLSPLGKMAARHGAAIVCVTHLNKGQGNNAVYRATGSLAFAAAARSYYLVAKDEADESRRLFLPGKCNLAADTSGLAYRLSSTGSINGMPSVQWEAEPVGATASSMLGDRAARDKTSAVDEAANWLREVLADGPLPATDIQQQAREAGHAWDGAIKRAKRDMKITPLRVDGRWVWGLPK